MNSVAAALDLPVDVVAPVAMPPGRGNYNIDALWAGIALALDEARLVQLDRIRVGQQGFRIRELANQVGNAGRMKGCRLTSVGAVTIPLTIEASGSAVSWFVLSWPARTDGVFWDRE